MKCERICASPAATGRSVTTSPAASPCRRSRLRARVRSLNDCDFGDREVERVQDDRGRRPSHAHRDVFVTRKGGGCQVGVNVVCNARGRRRPAGVERWQGLRVPRTLRQIRGSGRIGRTWVSRLDRISEKRPLPGAIAWSRNYLSGGGNPAEPTPCVVETGCCRTSRSGPVRRKRGRCSRGTTCGFRAGVVPTDRRRCGPSDRSGAWAPAAAVPHAHGR